MGSHDKLFKAVFSEPTNAVAHFEGFLPEELKAALDLAKAEHVPGSFVDEALTERHTDLLYRIPWRQQPDEADRELLLFVLFEHQSSPDAMMPFRMLRYMVRVWERWLQEHPDQKRLPPILPLVLYHGEQEWTAARELSELFDVDGVDPTALAALRPFLPQLRIKLDEVARLPDDEIPGQGVVRLTLLLFKHGRRTDVLDLLPGWFEEFRRLVTPDDPRLRNLELLVTYLMTVNDVASVDALRGFLAPLGDEAKEIPMTVGERLIEEGMQKGLQKGREEGRRERNLEVARKLLAKGMSPADVVDATDLPLEEVQKLAH